MEKEELCKEDGKWEKVHEKGGKEGNTATEEKEEGRKRCLREMDKVRDKAEHRSSMKGERRKRVKTEV
jgi:hypothetical protein